MPWRQGITDVNAVVLVPAQPMPIDSHEMANRGVREQVWWSSVGSLSRDWAELMGDDAPLCMGDAPRWWSDWAGVSATESVRLASTSGKASGWLPVSMNVLLAFLNAS
mmetsp:Transcript_17802/g.50609  ORF Transcript_17802/g.50609 Transcript_17802/m.50609 type:complete len:108 (+) Transcript_17802:1820-2143(+)